MMNINGIAYLILDRSPRHLLKYSQLPLQWLRQSTFLLGRSRNRSRRIRYAVNLVVSQVRLNENRGSYKEVCVLRPRFPTLPLRPSVILSEPERGIATKSLPKCNLNKGLEKINSLQSQNRVMPLRLSKDSLLRAAPIMRLGFSKSSLPRPDPYDHLWWHSCCLTLSPFGHAAHEQSCNTLCDIVERLGYLVNQL